MMSYPTFGVESNKKINIGKEKSEESFGQKPLGGIGNRDKKKCVIVAFPITRKPIVGKRMRNVWFVGVNSTGPKNAQREPRTQCHKNQKFQKDLLCY